MTLADEQLRGLDRSSLTENERALMRCQAAADFMLNGQFRAASEALGELWRGVGRRPNIAGLDEATAAEVLQQAGALSGWLGASRQVEGAQDAAKDLLSESAALFERLGDTARAAFARSGLALCYWREGAYDEARILLSRASEELAGADAERQATVLLRLLTVECAAGKLHDALAVLKESTPLLDASQNDALRGSFHNLYAMTLRRLGAVEGQGDYYDRAIIEYTAAVYHYERAGNARYAASIENNLAFLLYKLGRYRDAHEHLDRAGVVMVRLNEAGLLALVDETRARVLVAEKHFREAGRLISGVVQTLEKGGELASLSEALTVQGVVWARLGNYESSAEVLRRAVRVGEESGALPSAAGAALTLIEEHGVRRTISEDEVYDLYRRADRLLKDTQNAEELARLRACVRVVMRRLAGAQLGESNFSLFGAVHDLEAKFIARALEASEGSVTRAARLLGVRHQTLTAMLATRHKRLQSVRTPPLKRRRSIIKKSVKKVARAPKPTPEAVSSVKD
jgi:tetratricopeptide (TPR) repeat protein